MPDPASSLPLRPTRARYWVVVFAVTLAIIQYVDRVSISQAAPQVSADLSLTKAQMGWVFSAFTLAYALFEIPTGYWGDRIGPRRVLLRVVLWWSFFTAATGWVRSWASLVVVRFLFGAGEAGCFPNLARAFAHWLPRDDRTRAQGLLWMSARWGGAVTPLLVFALLQVMSWRGAFQVFALLGVVWAIVFAWWFRDYPREHKSVNAAEAALLPRSEEVQADHRGAPWGALVRSRTAWLLCGQYFACSYAWYFFVTWFPTYLLEVHRFDVKRSALLAGLPLLLGGCGAMLAGVLTPWLQRRAGGIGPARRGIGVVGFGGAALLLLAATWLRDPVLAVGAIAFAGLCNDLTLPGAWASCMDVGGRYVGTLGGAMNMVGNLGGFLSPIVLGYVVDRSGDWNLTFYVTAAVYGLGMLCWWFLDPVTPMEQPARERGRSGKSAD